MKVRFGLIADFFRIAVITGVISFFPVISIFADGKIISVTMIPANPGYGDLAVITVKLCASEYQQPAIALAVSTYNTLQAPGSGGQVFLVDVNGIDVKDVTFPSGGALGLTYTAVGIRTNDCNDCGAAPGVSMTLTYTVHIPTADYFTSCNPTNLYIHVGERNSNMQTSDWPTLNAACQGMITIPIGIPASNFSITKRFEGVLQATGDQVLFAVDYSYGGNGVFTITDPILVGGQFSLVSYGPTNSAGVVTVSAPLLGATSGTFSWTFPSRGGVAGAQTGTVWMLLKYNGATPVAGTAYTDTASGVQGAANQDSSATITAGMPAISIQKNAAASSVLSGTNITYIISYDVNGYALKNFQPFDSITASTYNHATGPPVGWKFLPTSGGEYGTWTISDPCNTGGRFITGSSVSATYPGLLLDDGDPTNSSDRFCDGMIVSDLYIQDTGYIGADAEIIIRSNGYNDPANGRSLGVIASIDEFPRRFMISQCGGSVQYCGNNTGPAGSWTDTPQVGRISAKKWYRVRVLVTNIAGGQRIRAKIWAKGDPEPVNWDIDYNNTSIGTNDWLCDGTGTYPADNWRPGVNQETSDVGGVQDSYDNFTVYEARTTPASTNVYDTVPANVNYGGCSGGCTPGGAPGSVVRWNLGSVSMTSGSYTWWGPVSGCVPVSNQALIGFTGLASIASNWVDTDVLCWSPTFTPTLTFTVTPTKGGTNTYTPTFTYTRTFTPTFTYTPTYTPTYTRTATPTFTYTSTATPTYTPTSTRTATPTYTDTNSPTPTYTATPTRTATSTYTDTSTPTSTYTATPTRTGTSTYTDTATPTSTYTATPTRTATSTYTSTSTPTNTISSDTPTNTKTYTPTFTATPTFTDTPTPSFTNTYTSTFTCTPTYTATPTYTKTSTATPTVTQTDVFTATVTPTITDTYTMTFTRTFTNTSTDTFTSTYTPTATPTRTQTPTFTQTYTLSSTPTITATIPPFPYLITLGVYNEAGELVRTIATKPASTAMSGAVFSIGGDIHATTLIPGGTPLSIYMPGIEIPETLGSVGTTFNWDGRTDGGQPVTPGPYYIKISQKDTYDHVMVLIKDFAVLQVEQYVQMVIYNSSGEIVRTIRKDTRPPDVMTLTTADVIVVKKTGSDIMINYGPGSVEYLKWDGKNSQGMAVTSGTYEVQLTSRTLSGNVSVVSKTVNILSEGNSKYVGDIKAYPNPYHGGGSMTFEWVSTGSLGEMTINIYNINGELIRSLRNRLEAGSLTWDGYTSGNELTSHGYYICIFTAKNTDGYVVQKKLKIAVLANGPDY